MADASRRPSRIAAPRCIVMAAADNSREAWWRQIQGSTNNERKPPNLRSHDDADAVDLSDLRRARPTPGAMDCGQFAVAFHGALRVMGLLQDARRTWLLPQEQSGTLLLIILRTES